MVELLMVQYMDSKVEVLLMQVGLVLGIKVVD
jgi:hypothetical protein